MVDAIGNFYASQVGEFILMILLMWGVFGIVVLIFGINLTGRTLILAWSGLVLLFLSIAVSMIVEDLLPGWHRLDPLSQWTRPIGLGVIFLGAMVFLGGGIVLSRGLLAWMAWSMSQPRPSRRRTSKPPAPAQVPLRPETTGLAPGPSERPRLMGRLIVMVLGFGLIFFGASLYHDSRFPLAWFWRWFGL